jgi:hypothetical protein
MKIINCRLFSQSRLPNIYRTCTPSKLRACSTSFGIVRVRSGPVAEISGTCSARTSPAGWIQRCAGGDFTSYGDWSVRQLSFYYTSQILFIIFIVLHTQNKTHTSHFQAYVHKQKIAPISVQELLSLYQHFRIDLFRDTDIPGYPRLTLDFSNHILHRFQLIPLLMTPSWFHFYTFLSMEGADSISLLPEPSQGICNPLYTAQKRPHGSLIQTYLILSLSFCLCPYSSL